MKLEVQNSIFEAKKSSPCTIDFYFDLWLLQSAAEKRVRLRESADFWRPSCRLMTFTRCSDVINDETLVRFGARSGESWRIKAVAWAALVDR